MLHRLAVEESESSDTTGSQTPVSVDAPEPLEASDRTPSTASAHGDVPPRTGSPAGSAGSGHSRKPSLTLLLRMASNGGSSDAEKKTGEDSLSRWLRDGTVVYKSVGLGLMDLVVGMHLVEVANRKKIGTRVEGF